jgi:hypothetical protein
MKKSKLLIVPALILLSGLVLQGCGSGDDSEAEVTTKDLVLGKWMYEAMEVNGANILENMDFFIYIDFHEDNSFTRDVAEITETGEWEILNDSTMLIKPDYGDQTEQKVIIEALSEEKFIYTIGNEALESRVILSRVAEEE